MILFIALLLIYIANLSWYWYLIAVVIWVLEQVYGDTAKILENQKTINDNLKELK